MKRTILICGLLGGVLIALLRWSEYHFLVLDHSVDIYAALIAATFAGLGIWLGIRLHRPRPASAALEPSDTAGVAFVPDDRKRDDLGITRREMEISELVAQGMTNREIADKLFVSENTVKTHCSRAFDKLGARRRTEAVLMGKRFGLIWSDPVNPADSMGLFLSLSLFLLFPEDRASSSLGRFERRLISLIFAGRNRIIMIRRELPLTVIASPVEPVA